MVDCGFKKTAEEELNTLRQFNQCTLMVWVCGVLLAAPALIFLYYPSLVRSKVNYLNIKLTGFLGGGASRQSIRILTMSIHYKARIETYPRTKDVKRFPVPDDKVPWSAEFAVYEPVDYTSPKVLEKPVWADPDIRHSDAVIRPPKWNSLDGVINRRSHLGNYEVIDKVPRNPVGRTGLRGRGCLGRWGPNHAADPIVTRWKRNTTGEVVKAKSGSPILQFIAVQRQDNKEWALPGGMVDAGEVVTVTLKREFGEEALNSLMATDDDKRQIRQSISDLFDRGGAEIYRGYVDDPRNTDNSWMETIAVNLHDERGENVARFKLNAGDDAVGVQWMDVDHSLQLYASHRDFIQKTAEKLQASW
ncbi:ADP-ribose pyrophosphatase, mitochondrial-like isoform X2 [Haliotis rufescens]|uniref:ADP-ribose pyrophosphatase, mitochondrial-like isoform X2 n=1 Tax=Haliotis rufescens TaxID=6454 RepID=UPI00201F31CA|nr:ADP-ribose pyrophosphatase, mitochondrial-like isoform X2 [Haliotis rufescens]